MSLCRHIPDILNPILVQHAVDKAFFHLYLCMPFSYLLMLLVLANQAMWIATCAGSHMGWLRSVGSIK